MCRISWVSDLVCTWPLHSRSRCIVFISTFLCVSCFAFPLVERRHVQSSLHSYCILRTVPLDKLCVFRLRLDLSGFSQCATVNLTDAQPAVAFEIKCRCPLETYLPHPRPISHPPSMLTSPRQGSGASLPIGSPGHHSTSPSRSNSAVAAHRSASASPASSPLQSSSLATKQPRRGSLTSQTADSSSSPGPRSPTKSRRHHGSHRHDLGSGAGPTSAFYHSLPGRTSSAGGLGAFLGTTTSSAGRHTSPPPTRSTVYGPCVKRIPVEVTSDIVLAGSGVSGRDALNYDSDEEDADGGDEGGVESGGGGGDNAAGEKGTKERKRSSFRKTYR